MKSNLFPALFLIAVCNTYAMPVEGGKLLSHIESVAPNVKLSFKQSKINLQKNLKFIDLKASSTRREYIQIMNNFGDINVGGGYHGATIINGNDYNDVLIFNYSSEQKTYKITHEICTGPSDFPATICSSSINTVSVEPNSFIHDLTIPVLEITFPQSGQYDASILVKIETANNASLIESIDFRVITIPVSTSKE